MNVITWITIPLSWPDRVSDAASMTYLDLHLLPLVRCLLLLLQLLALGSATQTYLAGVPFVSTAIVDSCNRELAFTFLCSRCRLVYGRYIYIYMGIREYKSASLFTILNKRKSVEFLFVIVLPRPPHEQNSYLTVPTNRTAPRTELLYQASWKAKMKKNCSGSPWRSVGAGHFFYFF